jgi:hypothetical protein
MGLVQSWSEERLGVDVLGLAACEHVKALSFEARAEQCRVTHSLVRENGVGRGSHRYGGDALFGRRALVQTQVHPAHSFVLAQEARNTIRDHVHHCRRKSANRKLICITRGRTSLDAYL